MREDGRSLDDDLPSTSDTPSDSLPPFPLRPASAREGQGEGQPGREGGSQEIKEERKGKGAWDGKEAWL